MEKILEVAAAIKEPYSLVALIFLIFLILSKAVVSKTGDQKGERGFKLQKLIIFMVSIIAATTLTYSFAYKAYVVYSPSEKKRSDLKVQHIDRGYDETELLIGYTGNGIIVVSSLTINWDYNNCYKLTLPPIGAMLTEYKYRVHINTRQGSKQIESRKFKYGNGDLDSFLVDISWAENGNYDLWWSLKYRWLGDDKEFTYTSEKIRHSICFKKF